MRRALPRLCGSVIVLGLVVAASAAMAQGSSNMIGAQQMKARKLCKPPLKFAAGACVRRCPAGYRNTGGYCRFQSMSR